MDHHELTNLSDGIRITTAQRHFSYVKDGALTPLIPAVSDCDGVV